MRSRLAEAVYRVAENEWKDFIEAVTDIMVENDPQIPHLPPKDVIHRIYRDVSCLLPIHAADSYFSMQIRFSPDKTPYKKGFSASFSRSGRKGIFAGCEYRAVTAIANAPEQNVHRSCVRISYSQSLIADTEYR